jgi:hypothetical protein
MNNPTTNNLNLQFNSAPSRRDLLESTKLSRLPQRTPFVLPDFDNTPTKSVAIVAVCAGCNGRLEPENTFQNSIHGCRKCITIYARIDSAIEESANRKKKVLLEKMIGGVE